MKFSSKFKVRTKVDIFLVVVGLAFVSILISLVFYKKYIENSFDRMKNHELFIKNLSQNIKSNILVMHKIVLTSSFLHDKNIENIDFLNSKITISLKKLKLLSKDCRNKKLSDILKKLQIRYKAYYNISKNMPNTFEQDYQDGIIALKGLESISNRMYKELDTLANYSDDIFKNRIDQLNKNFTKMLYIMGSIVTVVIIGFVVFGYILSDLIKKSLYVIDKGIENFFNFMDGKVKEVRPIKIANQDEFAEIAKHINNNIDKAREIVLKEREFKKYLSSRVEEEIKKNKEKDLILLEQTKMANLGEMINNIIHQWRQPLGTISSLVTGMMLKIDMGMFKKEELPQKLEKIDEMVKYLNENLYTFRNYILEEKVIKEVILQNRINDALKIVGLSLKDKGISLHKNLEKEPISYKLVIGELTEVIINIINNAKDALVDNKIQNPWVKVELFKEGEEITISIEDNAGGVPENIIDKIFEKKFTTKDKSRGTGIGLYMSKKIIEESLKGKLSVVNTKNGAKFTIKLKLSVS